MKQEKHNIKVSS